METETHPNKSRSPLDPLLSDQDQLRSPLDPLLSDQDQLRSPLDPLLSDQDQIQDLVAFARDAACLHGVLMKPPDALNPAHVTHLPFTLMPSPVPRAAYAQVLELQTLMNCLVDRVSQDQAFLQEALSSVVEVDDFTARLFHIYKQIQREEKTPTIVLGLNRCDYMLQCGSCFKQVEINTFAAGLGGVSGRVLDLHKDVLRFSGRQDQIENLVENSPCEGQVSALARAWELYGAHRAVVLLLALPSDFNFGHRCLQRALLERNIHMVHRSLEDVCASGVLDQEDRLFVEGREVAVVYYRYGYDPQHYTDQLWETRLRLELSRAVKCPDIATHLTGTKKVQQALCRPGTLERFFPQRPHVVEQIRAVFTGLYGLDPGPEGDRVMDEALADPERFVLKPQREGGGNTVFGADVRRALNAAEGKQRAAFILMDRIQSPTCVNVMVSAQCPPVVSQCTSELGVFGAYIRQDGQLLWNQAVAHTLRVKMAEHLEVGLSMGGGAVSCPLLS